jgi:hypothetical protein
MDLFVLLDDADAIVDYIFQHYERAIAGPSSAERDRYMEL